MFVDIIVALVQDKQLHRETTTLFVEKKNDPQQAFFSSFLFYSKHEFRIEIVQGNEGVFHLLLSHAN